MTGDPAKLPVNFLGLFGPNGPMPVHITEYARERQLNAHDPTLVGFLDLFHHRILSLFYRAWAVNQKAADLDRPKDARFPDLYRHILWDRHRVIARPRCSSRQREALLLRSPRLQDATRRGT